eukprot:1849795-Prymnesium_polylepis.1
MQCGRARAASVCLQRPGCLAPRSQYWLRWQRHGIATRSTEGSSRRATLGGRPSGFGTGTGFGAGGAATTAPLSRGMMRQRPEWFSPRTQRSLRRHAVITLQRPGWRRPRTQRQLRSQICGVLQIPARAARARRGTTLRERRRESGGGGPALGGGQGGAACEEAHACDPSSNRGTHRGGPHTACTRRP